MKRHGKEKGSGDTHCIALHLSEGASGVTGFLQAKMLTSNCVSMSRAGRIELGVLYSLTYYAKHEYCNTY